MLGPQAQVSGRELFPHQPSSKHTAFVLPSISCRIPGSLQQVVSPLSCPGLVHQYESQPIVFTKWSQSRTGRLRLTCFQQKFQSAETGVKLLFNPLADQPLRHFEEAPKLNLECPGELRAVLLSFKLHGAPDR